MDPSHTATRQALPFHLVAMSPTSLAKTAAMHEALLPNGLFPAMGQRFLRRWHQTFVTSPYAFGLAAHDQQGNCCGFLIGTTDQERYTQDVLRRDGYRLTVLGVISLASRPRLAARFTRTRAKRYLLRLIARRQRDAAPQRRGSRAKAPVAVLHALITVPEVRCNGVGASLVGRFEQELRTRGVSTLQLVTLASSGAAGFYTRLGFVESDRRTNRDGEVIVQFDRYLGAAP